MTERNTQHADPNMNIFHDSAYSGSTAGIPTGHPGTCRMPSHASRQGGSSISSTDGKKKQTTDEHDE